MPDLTYQQEYYRKNKDKFKERNDLWRENNPGYMAKQCLNWRETFPEKHHKSCANWVDKNIKSVREYQHEYYLTKTKPKRNSKS